MGRLLLLCATLLMLVCLSGATDTHSVSDEQLRRAIADLHGDDSSKEFKLLYRNPARASELLIADLRPVKRGQYISGKHPHVVWELRALRSLTGLDFRGRTKADLDEEETHFLDANARDEVRFFGTWMSRDRVWVAPLDAQQSIIHQWRTWFAKSGAKHVYVNDPNFDNWYF